MTVMYAIFFIIECKYNQIQENHQKKKFTKVHLGLFLSHYLMKFKEDGFEITTKQKRESQFVTPVFMIVCPFGL